MAKIIINVFRPITITYKTANVINVHKGHHLYRSDGTVSSDTLKPTIVIRLVSIQ